MTDAELFLTIKSCPNYKTSGTDVQYCIFRSIEEKKIYLMFQETRGRTDIITDLDFPATVYKRQRNKFLVHRGFVKAWKSCNDIVMNEFMSQYFMSADYTPVITGWSYGGAMAQLAAEDFFFRTGVKADVITYGSPKILYFKYSRDHFKNSCNVVRQFAQPNDLITAVVPFFCWHINKVKCGARFCLLKALRTKYYHKNYDLVLE